MNHFARPLALVIVLFPASFAAGVFKIYLGGRPGMANQANAADLVAQQPLDHADRGSSDAAARAKPQADVQPEQPAAPRPEQSYVGSSQCFICHRPHTNAWSETKHAQAFTHLQEHYRDNSSCLKCHVTGFGEQRGYVSGTEKDLLMVGCESCHGPGARHIDAAQRFVLATGDEAKLEKEMRETIVKTPADSVCIKCHIAQAHQRHPAYHGEPPAQFAGRAAPRGISSAPAWYSSGYNVKTCGACHYDRYKQWTTEKHSALSSVLPAKYWNDQECAKCHPKADALVKTSTNVTDPHYHGIGAVCESCHGPGLDHVRFNKRYISGPPLGPKLEQAARLSIRKGKPATACVGCHVGEGHKPHPEFDKKG
jgi:hypothetical protein